MTNQQNRPGGRADGRAVKIVGGRYELGELLGRGGMAEVHKGTDVRLGRTVAVKQLRTDLAGDTIFQARFRREAQSSASLNHPSIVAVYDTGEETSTDGSQVAQPYIVMEYVEGKTLRDILRQGRKILPERALEISAGVLSALEYSHRAGIIHRDIKPANVMLTPTGDVKVMDFGIARAIADGATTMTQTAAVIGTAQYLSPEQARGETVDSRSDVYSAGCLLYELLTGRPPFVGESPVAVAYQHVREQAAPPSALDPEIPPEVDAIVMKSLAKRLEDRYQSAGDMHDDIERWLAGEQVLAPMAAGVQTPFLPHDQATEATAIFSGSPLPEAPEEKRKRWPLALLAVAILALFVGAAVVGTVLFNTGEDEVQVPSLLNMTPDEAEAALADVELVLGDVSRRASEDVPQGRILSQDPEDGATLEAGGEVDVVVSTGRPEVVVPDVLGDDRNDARRELEGLGLEVDMRERESDEEKDVVVDTDPRPATRVERGSTVTVFYSDGLESVPSVVGMKENQARQTLERAGFTVSVEHDAETRAERGTVLRQSPEAASLHPSGTTVVITVSSYEEPSPTPSPSPSPTITESPSPEPTTSPPEEEDGGEGEG